MGSLNGANCITSIVLPGTQPNSTNFSGNLSKDSFTTIAFSPILSSNKVNFSPVFYATNVIFL